MVTGWLPSACSGTCFVSWLSSFMSFIFARHGAEALGSSVFPGVAAAAARNICYTQKIASFLSDLIVITPHSAGIFRAL